MELSLNLLELSLEISYFVGKKKLIIKTAKKYFLNQIITLETLI